jgi:tetratricopeptide (TPR) repeat protein
MEWGTRRKSVNVLWAILGVALVIIVSVKIARRPPTSVRGPLKILTPPFTANKAELIQELRDRKFQVLDAQLNSYQKDFETNVLAEDNLTLAFDAFKFTDPSLGPILDEWVKNEPESCPAHMARAKYLLELGWQARGHRYADKTTEQQFNEMARIFGESVKDAVMAIKLNPKSAPAYAVIIQAARGVSDYKTLNSVYGASLKYVPLSVWTRISVITTLEPKWAGSYEAMAKFADGAQKDVARNPRLQSLKGFADIDRGDAAWDAGNLRQAIGFYNHALEEGGDFAQAYGARGAAYNQLQLYNDALEDLLRANKLRPQEPLTLERLAWVYLHLNRPQDTLAVIQEYQQFATLDPDLVRLQQWAQNFQAGVAQTVKTGGN